MKIAVTSVSLSHNELTGLNLPSNSLPMLTELNSEFVQVFLKQCCPHNQLVILVRDFAFDVHVYSRLSCSLVFTVHIRHLDQPGRLD
jgi:hypothetical protein